MSLWPFSVIFDHFLDNPGWLRDSQYYGATAKYGSKMIENMVWLMGYCSDCSKNGVMHTTWLYESVTVSYTHLTLPTKA